MFYGEHTNNIFYIRNSESGNLLKFICRRSMAFIYLRSLLFAVDSLSIPCVCVVWIRYSGVFLFFFSVHILLFLMRRRKTYDGQSEIVMRTSVHYTETVK